MIERADAREPMADAGPPPCTHGRGGGRRQADDPIDPRVRVFGPPAGGTRHGIVGGGRGVPRARDTDVAAVTAIRRAGETGRGARRTVPEGRADGSRDRAAARPTPRRSPRRSDGRMTVAPAGGDAAP